MNRTAHEIRCLSSVPTHEVPSFNGSHERYSATNETGQRAHPSRPELVVAQCVPDHNKAVTGSVSAWVVRRGEDPHT